MQRKEVGPVADRESADGSVKYGPQRGRVGLDENGPVLVARDDRVDRRVIPSAETVEAKCVSL